MEQHSAVSTSSEESSPRASIGQTSIGAGPCARVDRGRQDLLSSLQAPARTFRDRGCEPVWRRIGPARTFRRRGGAGPKEHTVGDTKVEPVRRRTGSETPAW
jgi:hypothetical protein